MVRERTMHHRRLQNILCRNGEANHYNGVAIIGSNRIKDTVKNYVAISDRVILIQFRAKPFDTNIIQVYAPTADSTEEVIEQFYEDLKQALRVRKSNEYTIIIGDFNIKVGKGECQSIVGTYGLGERNSKGDRLIQFCHEEGYIITNTFFKLPPRRLHTWKSSAKKEDKLVRNQIDYILVKTRFRNWIKSAKTYPGADVGSDHNPVVAVIRARLKRIAKKNGRQEV